MAQQGSLIAPVKFPALVKSTSSTKANAEVQEMPHLNGSPVGFGIQLHCGQYLTLHRQEQERGFSSGCATVSWRRSSLPPHQLFAP